MTRLYPMFLNLDGARVLVVGGGAVAARKVLSLARCGALATVVAPVVCDEIRALSDSYPIVLHGREFQPDDVAGKRLVIAATACADVNEAVVAECRRLGVWVNVVDDPARCDFHVPAVVERGPVQVAISTGGKVPTLSRWLKDELSEIIEPSLGVYAKLLAEARQRIRQAYSDRSDDERRRAMEMVLASEARGLLARGDEVGARAAVEAVLQLILADKRAGDASS